MSDADRLSVHPPGMKAAHGVLVSLVDDSAYPPLTVERYGWCGLPAERAREVYEHVRADLESCSSQGAAALTVGAEPPQKEDRSECGRCGHTAFHHAMLGDKACQIPSGCSCHEFTAALWAERVPSQPPTEIDVQLLAWATVNCHVLARRALAHSTSAYDREKWEHVLRICEKAGARSKGILRLSVPTEITEGSDRADPNPVCEMCGSFLKYCKCAASTGAERTQQERMENAVADAWWIGRASTVELSPDVSAAPALKAACAQTVESLLKVHRLKLEAAGVPSQPAPKKRFIGPRPMPPDLSCRGCGNENDCAFMAEDGPGPFCSLCWTALEAEFAKPKLAAGVASPWSDSISPSPPPPGWQPMESAPDGSRVLVFVPPVENYISGVFTAVKIKLTGNWVLAGGVGPLVTTPTLWMPLPPVSKDDCNG